MIIATVGALRSQPRAVERGNAEIRGDGHVSRVVDEIPQPVVVTLLRAPRSRHADDHPAIRSRRSTLTSRRRSVDVAAGDDNSREKSRMSVWTARRFVDAARL